MKDERIKYRPAERRALIVHGVRAFCLTSAPHTLCTGWDRMCPEPNAGERVHYPSAVLDVAVRTVGTLSPTTALGAERCSARQPGAHPAVVMFNLHDLRHLYTSGQCQR